MNDFQILLIEDSQLDAELAIEVLCDSGHTKQSIHWINDLDDVARSIGSNDYMVVVSDYDLVTYNLLDVMEAIKELPIKPPIICLTGAIGEEKAAILVQKGINGYLLKENINNLPKLIETVYKEHEKCRQLQIMQQTIMSSEKKYRSLFENLPIGVATHEIVYDSNKKPVDYRITELNIMAESILGLKRSEILGKLASKAYDDQPPYLDIYSNTEKTKSIYRFETYYKKMDKSFDITVYSIEPNKFITIFSDISERVKTEAQLRNGQKLESIGTLASGVAHEINNPINGILNYGQVILDLSDYGSEINKYAAEIISETNRVSEIVKNLLDFSRQSGVQHSYAHIEDIIDKTLSLMNTILRHDNIYLSLDIARNISKLKCRSQQIQQVIMNLLTNARDALNEKYPEHDENKKIIITCREFSKGNRKWISIAIEDFGKGMSESIKQRIFDPFFTTKEKNKGTGLGLSISFGIIKEHHGEILVDSREGEYTRFTVVLPCDNGWDLE